MPGSLELRGSAISEPPSVGLMSVPVSPLSGDTPKILKVTHLRFHLGGDSIDNNINIIYNANNFDNIMQNALGNASGNAERQQSYAGQTGQIGDGSAGSVDQDNQFIHQAIWHAPEPVLEKAFGLTQRE